MMNYSVYMHICPNGKKYVGITRKKPHLRWANGLGYQRNKHFYKAIQKYGWDNIEHKIISNWLSEEKATELEKHLIKKYKTNDTKYGFNKTNGGEKQKEYTEEALKNMRGRKISEKHRRILSEANKGNKAFLGKNHTKETKEHLSAIRKGKPASNKTKIEQYKKDGTFVKKYNSMSEAIKDMTSSKSVSGICLCCKGERKTAYGYVWKYVE